MGIPHCGIPDFRLNLVLPDPSYTMAQSVNSVRLAV